MLIETAPRAIAGPPNQTLRPRTLLLWAIAITFVYMVLALGDAFASVPWCDEAWLSNPALTFLRHGYLGTPILTAFGWGPPQSLLHIEHRTYWIMPLQMLGEIGWFKAWGYSLLSLRTFSIFWGALAIAGTGALAQLLTNRPPAALGAMALLGTDYYFLTRASDGRMDMMAAALMLLAFAAYLWQRGRSLTRAVALASALAAATAFTHPVGGFFVLLGLGFLAWRLDRHRLGMKHLLLFGLPFVAGASLWGLYVVQDLPAFRSQMAGNSTGRWDGILQPYWSVYREVRFKYFQAFGLNTFGGFSLQDLRLVALAFYIAGWIGVACTRALRNQRGVGALLWLTSLFVFGGMAFDGAKRWYYLVYVVPLFAALLALWIERLWKTANRATIACAVAVLLAIQVGGTLYRIRKNDYAKQFLPAAQFVRDHDRDRSLILGSGELGFELDFPDYLVDDVSLGYFSGSKPKWIFVPEGYWSMWLDTLKTRKPPVGQFVASRLRDEYTVAFNNGAYRVYQRKDAVRQ